MSYRLIRLGFLHAIENSNSARSLLDSGQSKNSLYLFLKRSSISSIGVFVGTSKASAASSLYCLNFNCELMPYSSIVHAGILERPTPLVVSHAINTHPGVTEHIRPVGILVMQRSTRLLRLLVNGSAVSLEAFQ